MGFPTVILKYRAEDVGHYQPTGEHVIVPGRYERDLVDWAIQLAPGSQQFVDCGAHTGSWTIVMARHFREGHAFEPQRLIFQQLCGNLALNGFENVFAYNVGLDAAPGQLTLHRRGVDRGSSSGRPDVAARFEVDGVTTSLEIVPVVTIDGYVDVLNDVGLIKIDVEGLELRVLHGAAEVIRRSRPKMLIECWSRDWYRKDKEELLLFLEAAGYRVVPIAGYVDMLLAEDRDLSTD